MSDRYEAAADAAREEWVSETRRSAGRAMGEPLWRFAQARAYEDAAALDCGLFDHDESRSGHNIPCSQPPHTDCDFRDKREWIAKRRILEHARWAIEDEGGGAEDFASFALGALAAVYADHEDYRDEWKP